MYIQELATRLTAFGETVTVVVTNTEMAPAREEFMGVRILRIPCWNILGGTYPIPKPSRILFSLWGYIRRNKVDVINTQTRFFLTTFLGWLLAKTTRRPLYHTEHGTSHVVLPSKTYRWLSLVYDHTLGWLVIRTADVVITAASASVDFSKHLGASSCQLVYNGVDTKYFTPAVSQATGGAEYARPYILYIGRLIMAKGVQDLIEAFRSLPQDGRHTELCIVGQGNYQQQLKTIAGGASNIRFLGHVSTEEIRRLYQHATVFVNPSYSEGLPTSVLEALACGCPVIATNVGGTAEIATITNTLNHGLQLIQPRQPHELAAAIARYVGATKRVSVAGDLKPFSWDHIAAHFRQLLQNGIPS